MVSIIVINKGKHLTHKPGVYPNQFITIGMYSVSLKLQVRKHFIQCTTKEYNIYYTFRNSHHLLCPIYYSIFMYLSIGYFKLYTNFTISLMLLIVSLSKSHIFSVNLALEIHLACSTFI